MSVCTSTSTPRVCSGLMYATVPTAAPSRVTSVRAIFASPKSRIATRPSDVTIRLAGFTSRWTIPASCAHWSPAAIWAT